MFDLEAAARGARQECGAADIQSPAEADPATLDHLTEELHCLILGNLDNKALLRGPALVNKAWLKLATSAAVWYPRCGTTELSRFCPSPRLSGPGPSLWRSLKRTELSAPFTASKQRAIPRRPTAEGSWRTTKYSGTGWQHKRADNFRGDTLVPCCQTIWVGQPDSGADEALLGIASHASRGWCEMLQEINLVTKVSELAQECSDPQAAAAAYLDSSPHLKFVVWVGPSAACGGRCQVTVFVDGNDVCLPDYRGASKNFAWQRDAIKFWQKSVDFNAKEWGGRQSGLMDILLQDYPPGVRRICVVLGAGHPVDAEAVLADGSANEGPWFAMPCLSFSDPDLKVQKDILRQGKR